MTALRVCLPTWLVELLYYSSPSLCDKNHTVVAKYKVAKLTRRGQVVELAINSSILKQQVAVPDGSNLVTNSLSADKYLATIRRSTEIVTDSLLNRHVRTDLRVDNYLTNRQKVELTRRHDFF